ncbi:MAG: glycoside hydrolase family 18 protein [Gracilimonas sp.]|nr:glycoside hydrolase family 18 protein [Gracilimonas sp.]
MTQKIILFLSLFILVQCNFFSTDDESDKKEPVPNSGMWVSGYVASWNYNVGGHGNWGNTGREELNWNAFTHGIFFAQRISESTCLPGEPEAWENISPDRIIAFTEDAQANNVQAIMSFGGAGNEAFRECIETQPETIAQGIADFMNDWGFDGVDIDPEPVPDAESFENFMELLRQKIPNAIITGASMTGGNAAVAFAAAEEYFDQINIMTYDLSGAWGGWYSWHNSPIYNPSGGSEVVNIPGSGTEYPNIEQLVNKFQEAGVPLEKLGFGIDLYGYVWTGVNTPEQDASGATRRYGETSYDNLVEEFPGIATDPQWDENAKAAWYGTDNQFISFDNVRTIRAKFDYAREKGVGGMIVWEITGSKELSDEVATQLGN